MDDFLCASELMVARLQSLLSGVPARNIREAVSLEWAVKNPLSPSVNVIFFDDVPDTEPGGAALKGRTQNSNQLWLVLLSVRNVSDAGVAAQHDAGELMVQVLQSLQGYRLSDQHQPLYRQKCPFRKADKDGIAHFPFLFATKVTTTGLAV
jgi:hypothetical protein